MAKIEFSELNLSRTLIKTKEKRNLKGKQNCIYLLCFSMQNDWFLPHILIILVYLQYGPLCKFEIRAVLKKSETDWLRSYLSLNCIEMITFHEFLIFSSLLFNDGLTEISGNTVLSYRRNFRSQAFLVAPFFANKISNCTFFLFLMNLVLFWADKQDWKKNPAGEKRIKLLILIYWNQPTWSFTGSYKLFRALLLTK